MRTAHGKAAVGLLLAAWACGDALDVMSTPSGTITVSGPASARQGDVVMYGAEVRDTSGTLVTDSAIVWSVSPLGAGFIAADGRFVGYQAGAARVIARAGSLADSVTVVIQLRGLGGSLTVEGRGTIADRFTSDLWVHG
ncbi:MAG: hypothetical protein OEZ42_06640, partial [Gemmatimonadota bacterium]|nr:hypothetical protein [Gemmatimonadota bacterium]